MKTKKSLWQSVLVVALGMLMVFAVAGCSSTADKKRAANAPAASADESLSKSSQSRLVSGSIAVLLRLIPYDDNGKDRLLIRPDMAKDIAKHGRRTGTQELSFDALLTTLQSGQVDVIFRLSATAERRKTVDFFHSLLQRGASGADNQRQLGQVQQLQRFERQKNRRTALIAAG